MNNTDYYCGTLLTWHPAYVIRQRGDALAKTKREVWSDLQVALQCVRSSE